MDTIDTKKGVPRSRLAANEEFRNQYARAREEQLDALADEILQIADESRVGAVNLA